MKAQEEEDDDEDCVPVRTEIDENIPLTKPGYDPIPVTSFPPIKVPSLPLLFQSHTQRKTLLSLLRSKQLLLFTPLSVTLLSMELGRSLPQAHPRYPR